MLEGSRLTPYQRQNNRQHDIQFGLGLRQVTGLAESLLKLAQLDWKVPDYSIR